MWREWTIKEERVSRMLIAQLSNEHHYINSNPFNPTNNQFTNTPTTHSYIYIYTTHTHTHLIQVPAGYGGFISNLLSSDIIRKIAASSPAALAVVLCPPVAVEAVADACAAAGELSIYIYNICIVIYIPNLI